MTKHQERQQKIRNLCKERGISISKVGNVWHLDAPGIAIRVADLGFLDGRELNPIWRDIASACHNAR